MSRSMLLAATLSLSLLTTIASADDPRYFGIEVVDQSGRGVPLVELETVSRLRFITDSNGLVAISEPDLMGQTVYFTIRSHGYEYPQDGFGFRGKALQVEPGGKAVLNIQRTNIATRLYRATGSGIYRDTVLLGGTPPIAKPLLNAEVVGCDSVLAAIYRGKIHWFWGDTNKPGYPLGNFQVTGAMSRLPQDGGLPPDVGINFDYFVGKNNSVRGVAEMPGEGPTWISGLTVLRDNAGQELMYASYVKIRNQLESYQWGFVVWNDMTERFDKVATFDRRPPVFIEPQAHTFLRQEKNGSQYVYFTNPFPFTRVAADAAAFVEPGRYEGFTCLQAGTRADEKKLDRDSDGLLRYSWKLNTPPLSQQDQAALIKAGVMKPEESIVALRDVETGRAVQAHFGSVYWNDFRKRWVLIAVEQQGDSSFLGNVWFAEADSPTGPWAYARKIVTHNKYTFYNPKQHPFFDQEGGRIIFFEGTYTHTFSGNPDPTPRYDYNQIMYRLDLSAPALALPVPFYATSETAGAAKDAVPFVAHQSAKRPAFFALDRAHGDSRAVVRKGKALLAVLPPDDAHTALFYALASDDKTLPDITAPLYEYIPATDGEHVYTTDSAWSAVGYRRNPLPLCRVWKSPSKGAVIATSR